MQIDYNIEADDLEPLLHEFREVQSQKSMRIAAFLSEGNFPNFHTSLGSYFAGPGSAAAALALRRVYCLPPAAADFSCIGELFDEHASGDVAFFAAKVCPGCESLRQNPASPNGCHEGTNADDVMESLAGVCHLLTRRWMASPIRKGYFHGTLGPGALDVRTLGVVSVLALLSRLLEQGQSAVSLDFADKFASHVLTTAEFLPARGHSDLPYPEAGCPAEVVFIAPEGDKIICRGTRTGWSPHASTAKAVGFFMLGAVEALEFLRELPDDFECQGLIRREMISKISESLRRVFEYYLRHCDPHGLMLWDVSAPGIASLGDYRSKGIDPWNPHEPVDTAGSALVAQALLRFSEMARFRGDETAARRKRQAAFTISRTLFSGDFLSLEESHHGLLLHVVDDRPRNLPPTPRGRVTPCGESTITGDLALCGLAEVLECFIAERPPPRFFPDRPRTSSVDWSKRRRPS